jgi:hypothetical protein
MGESLLLRCTADAAPTRAPRDAPTVSWRMYRVDWLVWGVLYLAAHLLLYVLVVRSLPPFQTERGIFLYHLGSITLLACALLVALAMAPGGRMLPAAAALLSLHGIYSMSFLELWSLSEGGYRLSILHYVESATAHGTTVDLAALSQIGASKKANRLEGLERLKLVRRRAAVFELTPLGQVVAAALQAIGWAANFREVG